MQRPSRAESLFIEAVRPIFARRLTIRGMVKKISAYG